MSEQIAMLNGLGYFKMPKMSKATQRKREQYEAARRRRKQIGPGASTDLVIDHDTGAIVEEEISFIDRIVTFLGENKIIVAAVAGVFVVGTGILIYRKRKNRR